MIDVRLVDVDGAKRAGALLGRAGGADVVDALAVLLALPGDQVLTSDPDDPSRLASADEVAASSRCEQPVACASGDTAASVRRHVR